MCKAADDCVNGGTLIEIQSRVGNRGELATRHPQSRDVGDLFYDEITFEVSAMEYICFSDGRSLSQ
jgi:hypothetical protein